MGQNDSGLRTCFTYEWALLYKSDPKRPMKLWKKLISAVVIFSLTSGNLNLMAQETFTNRLVREKSPYLLQHAHNPVDWYPWGEEAFRKAKSENKPIFLSIGYSTCHWCHVMEEESFVNPDIAKVLNDYFVSIKVDREERPDVDHVFMQTVMAMTGAGGWPMSIFLTPDLKPFYGGTYFPPTDRWGRPGFITLLNAIRKKWVTEHDQILKSGEDITQALSEETARKTKGERVVLNENTLKTAYEQLGSRFDSSTGGFSDAPKFPQGHILSFLLRYWKRTSEADALEMVEKTLGKMAKGGIYDQLAGGFHRYSTDSEWRVPHFEKMLYDQAILAKAYLEAYQATRKEIYAQVAREIFDYVLRDMTDPKGGFYSAEDADSAVNPAALNQKSEGAFYIWSQDEIEKHLGREHARIFNFYFGVLPEGNAVQDPHGEFKRKNILYQDHSIAETVQEFEKSPPEISGILEDSKKKLIAVRNQRPRPHLDDKVLTDWNGLMISALAFGSRVLNEPRYQDAAKKASDFILAEMIPPPAFGPKGQSAHGRYADGGMKNKNGRLMHRYREGDVSIPAFLEDYAFFIHGLLDLYEATFDVRYLEEAKFLAAEMIRLFWDESENGFFLTGTDAEQLIPRAKEVYDGAIPSGNSVAVLSLLRLEHLTMDPKWDDYAQKTLNAFSNQIASYPSAFGQMMLALDFALGPAREIIIAGKEGDPEIKKIAKHIYSRFIPNKVTVFHPVSGTDKDKIEQISPFLKSQVPLDGRVTVYVCKNHVCALPVNEISKLEDLLDA